MAERSQYYYEKTQTPWKNTNMPDEIENNFMIDRSNRTNRLKENVFPEESLDVIPNIEMPHNSHIISSMVRMQKPAQRLRFLITNMIDYIEDTDAAVDSASTLGLASNFQIIDGLRRKIISSKNPSIISECVSSVQHISKGEQGATHIVKADFIPTLLNMLRSNDMKIVECVVSTLDNLMQFVNQSRELIRKANGIEKLVEQMDINDVKFLTVVINSLHKLTYNSVDGKEQMLGCHGSEKVVQILRQYTYEKLLFAASKLLKVLSVCNINKPVLVEIGAMEALSNLMRSGSPRLVLSCLWSIRNLSDYSSNINDMQKLIKHLIELIGSDDDHTAICALGCLCNLTSGNVENKIALIEYGGVQSVCQMICERIGQEEIVEPGVAALRHVTHNNHLAQQAVDIIIQSPLLSNLSALIRGQPDKMLPIIKAIVGLTRNLSMISPKCRRSLIDLGVTNTLCEIFYRTSNGITELSQQRNSIVSIASELSFIEGVRLEDLLELTLSALQALAKDNSAKKIISYENRLLQSIVQMVMIKENSIPLHRACLGLLAEMVEYADCARILEGEGFNTRLSELIHSTNKAISTYAAIVMYVINLSKPDDYRNRLNSEIFESLQDKLANLEDDEEMISYSPNSDYYGSQTQLNPVDNKTNPSYKYKNNPNFYENRAFEQDTDESPRNVPAKERNRQRKPQPFMDVEL
uniref:Beta-catenin n=1 Tax=Dugesia japonica TaxID=6161 RepID=Q589S3_DUGJA|nr:beta-catenin [Dugesia japonica]